MNSIACVFEKAAERSGRARNGSFGTEDILGKAEGQVPLEADRHIRRADTPLSRVSNLERNVQDLAQGQHQIQNAVSHTFVIGFGYSGLISAQLQQILSMLPQSSSVIPTPESLPFTLSHPLVNGSTGVSTANIFQTTISPASAFAHDSPDLASGQRMTFAPRSPQNTASGRSQEALDNQRVGSTKRTFPKLPGFATPVSSIGLDLADQSSRTMPSERMV